MTCVAYDRKRGSISVDSRVSGKAHIYTDSYIKFFHVEDGSILFFTGHHGQILKIKKAIREGSDWEDLINDEVDCIRSLPSGRVEEYEGGQWVVVQTSTAWGSGMCYAVGALFADGTSEQAVKAAVRYDTRCGGKVHTFKTKR